MSDNDIFADLNDAEKQRLTMRAAWSIPLFLMAAASVIYIPILATDRSQVMAAAMQAVVYVGLFVWVKPSVSKYGKGATAAIYLRAMGKASGWFVKVFAASVAVILAVMAYNQLVVVGDKALDVVSDVGDQAMGALDSAKEAIAEQLEPEPVPEPEPIAEAVAETEKAEIIEQQTPVTSVPTTQQPQEEAAPEPEPVDPAVARQKETDAKIAKAVDWLVPYLDSLLDLVNSTQYLDGKIVGSHSHGGYVRDDVSNDQSVYIETRYVGDDYEHEKSGFFDLGFLQEAKISCNEYDVRPRNCHFDLVVLEDGFLGGEGISCGNGKCVIQLFFFETDLQTARRVENAFNDIIDLAGNREPY